MGKGNPDPKIKKLEDENMELAVETGIRMFQRKWKLPVTGWLRVVIIGSDKGKWE